MHTNSNILAVPGQEESGLGGYPVSGLPQGAHEQPEVEKRIAALRAALEASTDEADKATLRRMIAEEEEYLRLGREIPPTLQELEDWAEGRPLREDR